MPKDANSGTRDNPPRDEMPEPSGATGEPSARPSVKVEDRRFSARQEEAESGDVPASPYPSLVEQFKRRAEEAEKTLREYVDAYKQSKAEQEQFRERLSRDLDRRVEERFGALVADLLDCLDDLDLALDHAREVPQTEALARGIAVARDRFLGALKRQGIERLDLEGAEFDPNVAEAVGVEPVNDPGWSGRVVREERPGYRLGNRVIRAARVVVGQTRG